MDTKRKCYQGCEIRNVKYTDGFTHLAFDIFDREGNLLNDISVCNRTVKEDLGKLFAHPSMRLFWAYGMVDIDIWEMAPDVFAIEWSLCDGVSCKYEVSRGELRKLLRQEAVK